jgi:hypothetical protein
VEDKVVEKAVQKVGVEVVAAAAIGGGGGLVVVPFVQNLPSFHFW